MLLLAFRLVHLVASLWGIFANSLIILAIKRESSLRNKNNFIIVGLAAAYVSLLVCTLSSNVTMLLGADCVPALRMLYPNCLCFVLYQQFAIALDRVLAIGKPMHYKVYKKWRYVATMYAGAVLIAVVVMICGIVDIELKEESQQSDDCYALTYVSNLYFKVFTVCVCVMVLVTCILYIVAYVLMRLTLRANVDADTYNKKKKILGTMVIIFAAEQLVNLTLNVVVGLVGPPRSTISSKIISQLISISGTLTTSVDFVVFWCRSELYREAFKRIFFKLKGVCLKGNAQVHTSQSPIALVDR